MATTYTVTNSLVADTTAIASNINQNNTDLLTALNSFDAGNLASGTVPLARISGLTATQLAAAAFKDEDDMASDSATAVSSQQAIKAHVTASRTDGYTPTTYAGYATHESVTFPNGLIRKCGQAAAKGAITFGTAFPTACEYVNIQGSWSATDTAYWVPYPRSVSTTGFTINQYSTAASTYYWEAWGY